jgi:hypothetical protein
MSSFTSCSSANPAPVIRHRTGAPLRAALFFVLVAATLWIAGELLERLALTLDFDLLKIREMMSMRGATNDIIYFGDSTTFDAVNPAIVDELLGTKSYNLSSGQQSLLASEMILRHYLANNSRPRLIMYGMFINRARSSSQVSVPLYDSLEPDLRELYRERFLKYEGRFVPWSDTALNSLKAYRYRNAIGYGIKYLIMGEKRCPKLIQGHLAFELSRPIEFDVVRTVDVVPPGLDDFLAYCGKQGLPVLIFEPPTMPGYSARTQGRAGLLACMAACVRSEPLVVFRSFNDEASLPYAADEWYVLNHLNAKGAVRFTRDQIVPYLREFLDAGNRRGGP